VNNYVPSISESFNARSTTTTELSHTFISNEYFERLSSPNNTIMVGPRGSGKTTLMRMLEVESLELWDKDIAVYFRKNINFSGIFIPTDRFWKTQFDKLFKSFNENNINLKILEALFIYHVVERFINVVCYRASRTIQKDNNFRSVQLSKEDEVELVYELAKILKVKSRSPSLRNLVVVLTHKKQELSTFLSSVSTMKSHNELPIIMDGELVTLLSSCVNMVNIYFNERGHKWAFLFDELELAPDTLVQPLVNAMRGGPEDIIFKLALSPYHKGVSITDSPESSMKSEDVRFVNLSSKVHKDGYKFAKELCENIFHRAGFKNPIESYFDEPSKLDMKKEISDLKEKDASFSKYLDNKGFNIDEFDIYEEKQLSLLRKVQFIVQLRNFQINERSHLTSRRRAANFYAGFKNICKATEYNPRMLIGIMSMFIPIIKDSKNKKVSIPKQISCISSYFDSFKALLSTIAVDSTYQEFNTIYDVIEKIALYFKREINGTTFKPDPKGSLVFRKIGNEGFVEAIGYALNSGALIAAKQNVGNYQDVVDISKANCRLSYIFAHHFNLLMTNQREIDLVDLLNIKHNNKRNVYVIDPSISLPDQLSLL
jgi:hypothetical protein